MKRLMMLMLTASLLLCGCSPLVDEDQTIDLYASFYPLYALMEGLTRDIPDLHLHCLVQPQDGCLRDYALSDWDLYLLASSADAVIMGGRGLESFESTLFSLGDHGPAVSAVLYNLDLLNQDDAVTSDEEATHFDGPNPHLYMSAAGAVQILESMNASLISLDPEYTAIYEANLEKARSKLEALQKEIQSISESIAGKKAIVMNEALAYTAADFKLETVLTIERESGTALYDSELDVCLETLTKEDAQVILIEKQAPETFVNRLQEAGYTVIRIDIFADHVIPGGFEDYLQTQKKNAEAIADAFST